mmetsp:Transcript_10002/g.25377  ORF Transcript_10002/g.25377 Transcript_10002/m.25377 type:complete len:299 (+) Transcript_10002:3357-4253(+)
MLGSMVPMLRRSAGPSAAPSLPKTLRASATRFLLLSDSRPLRALKRSLRTPGSSAAPPHPGSFVSAIMPSRACRAALRSFQLLLYRSLINFCVMRDVMSTRGPSAPSMSSTSGSSESPDGAAAPAAADGFAFGFVAPRTLRSGSCGCSLNGFLLHSFSMFDSSALFSSSPGAALSTASVPALPRKVLAHPIASIAAFLTSGDAAAFSEVLHMPSTTLRSTALGDGAAVAPNASILAVRKRRISESSFGFFFATSEPPAWNTCLTTNVGEVHSARFRNSSLVGTLSFVSLSFAVHAKMA